VDVGGARREIGAREIVVCAGAIYSPVLLMRSGIGPATELEALGIDVRADLPGVGRNLQNHPVVFVAAHLRRDARQPGAIRPHPMTCFRYSSGLPGAPASDMFVGAYSKSSWNALGGQIASLNTCVYKPASRGRVSLASADPREPPLIECNFLDEELDLLRLMDGMRRVIDLVTYEPVRSLCTTVFPVRFTDRIRRLNRLTRFNAAKTRMIATALDLVPGLADFAFGRLTGARVDFAELARDRAALADHVRANVAGTFHVSGTCRMGRSDDRVAVVDPDGRVHGLGGLRVADAAIMPAVPRGNTNLPTIMLAEKLAAQICAEGKAGTMAGRS
jgi:5-(hydroxymethyl)furfural/furfural oxidase